MSTVVNSKAPKGEAVNEPTGAIAADSLAAESLNSGGDFAADNPHPQVLGVKGGQSTLNNEETSNAKELHAARNREERDIGDNVAAKKYPEQAGAPGLSGTASQEGYAGGPSQSTTGTQSTGTGSHTYPHESSSASATTSSTSTGIGIRPYVDQAPNYAAAAATSTDDGTQKPRGKNLHEDQDIAPNKVTFTGAIGGPNDPGRLAEQTYTKMGGSNISAGAVRDNAAQVDGANQYDALDNSERV